MKPRQAIRFFSRTLSPTKWHFILVMILAFAYLAQVAIFIASIDTIPPLELTGLKKISAFFWTYAALVATLYTLIQFLVLLIWKISQYLKGTANLKETRLALTWSLVCAAPMGFFVLLFQFTFNHPGVGFAAIAEIIAVIGFVLFLAYGMITFLSALAVVNHFNRSKSLSTGVVTLLVIIGIYVVITFLRTFLRRIF